MSPKTPSQNAMDVGRWTEVFRATGLDDEAMHRWHHEFESRYPEGHQGFLEWLGLSVDRIGEIRDKSARS